jgi:hypothetical protein
LRDGFIFHFDICYGVATDIGEAVVVGMVIATFQQDAIGKFVPNLEVDTYRSNGICQNFFVMCTEGITHLKLYKLKKACRDDKPLV